MNKIIKGVFKSECKGRFLCEVEINGIPEICYIASSAKLDKFVELREKSVYLLENTGNNTKTKYALFAYEKTKDNIILLNLNRINLILRDYLIAKGLKEELLKSEITLYNGLKADLVYNSSPIVIYEAKTILDRDKKAIFPSIQTKRVKSQLEKFISLLKEGYGVEYSFFVLDSEIMQAKINTEEPQIVKLFSEAIELKMNICIYKTLWNGNDFYVEEDKQMKKNLLQEFEHHKQIYSKESD